MKHFRSRKFFYMVVILSFSYGEHTIAKERKKNVIYKYKKVETLDFGALNIKGKIMRPGDLSVKFHKRKNFTGKFKLKKSFDDEIKQDLRELD